SGNGSQSVSTGCGFKGQYNGIALAGGDINLTATSAAGTPLSIAGEVAMQDGILTVNSPAVTLSTLRYLGGITGNMSVRSLYPGADLNITTIRNFGIGANGVPELFAGNIGINNFSVMSAGGLNISLPGLASNTLYAVAAKDINIPG